MDTLIIFVTLLSTAVLLNWMFGAYVKLRTWAWNWKDAWNAGLRDSVTEDRLWAALLWLIAWMVAL